MRVDLHTHSSVSDGTDEPAVLVRNAVAAGLDVVALADHDTFDGLAEARDEARRAGIVLVPALEMSCEVAGASVHLLGYGPDVADPALGRELERIREGRENRVLAMLARLATLGYPLSAEEVAAQAADATSIGRPHIADALVTKGFFPGRDEVFAGLLADDGPAYVDRYATPLRTAVALLRAAGGVPVLAHPWGRASRRRLTPEVIAATAEVGLAGLEAHHTDHDPATEAELAALAESLGLIVTGGSDHHGLGKPDNPLGVRLTGTDQWRRLRGLLSEVW